MQLTLHTVAGSLRGNVILSAAEHSKTPINAQYMEWADQKSKENLERNPMGQTPVLETAQGFISQTMAILRYIGSLAQVNSSNIYGANEFEKAQVDQWIDFVQFELFPNCLSPLVLKMWGWKEFSDSEIQECYIKSDRFFPYLEQKLQGNVFLVGKEATLADFALYGHIVHVYRWAVKNEFRQKYPNILKWFETQSVLSANIKYYGKNRYAENPWI